MNFERSNKKAVSGLLLTPLIDIVFILIIFFMLTTSFMRVESLELILPSKGGKAAQKQDVIKFMIYDNGEAQLSGKILKANEINASLRELFSKDENARIMILTGDNVSMQQLVSAMDQIYAAGGQSIFVRKMNARR